MMTSFVLNDGEESRGTGTASSWTNTAGLKRVQHGGADVAHRSMLVYYPEINAGITTQSNHAQFNSNVTFELAEAFFGDEMELDEEGEGDEEGAEFDADSYDPEDFDEFVGRYPLDAAPSFVLTFTREGETLYAQATGQQRLEIVPTSDSTFRLLAVEASVTFVRGEDGAVEGAIMHQNGQDQPATRLADDEAPEEWAPTEDDLADYAGRFYSEELETFYTFTVKEGKLVMHQRRLGDVTLEPGEEEHFTGGNLTFVFERDRNGVVIGFYLSNVRTRDVRFGRVE